MVNRPQPAPTRQRDGDERPSTRRGTPPKARGERAYNLVVLAIAVMFLNVWAAATLPLWSHQIQRDKEADLIFRGLQYAEAIRIFQLRFQRLPTRLEELIEVEPRCIRQLWENPMREDGRWGLIPVGQTPGSSAGLQNQENNGLDPDPFAEEGKEGETPGVLLSRDPDDEFGAPPSGVQIRGVFNPGDGEPIRSFLGKDAYGEWHFTVELVSAVQTSATDPSFQPPFLAHFIGLPWPPGVVPQTPQPSSEPRNQQQQQQNLGGPDGGAGGDGSGRVGTQQNINPQAGGQNRGPGSGQGNRNR
ncbi:MAG: hypothetical protein AAGN66_21240 [Acidobacteriota bacterium]